MRIGIDVDGVLADQVAAVAPRIEALYGIQLAYDDLTEWRYPVGPSDIGREIVAAMDDPEWVRNMPVHTGAAAALRSLGRLGRIVIVTARPEHAEQPTREWLDNNRLLYHDFVCCPDARKAEQSLDLLVDDYLGNIESFLGSTSGLAVLMDRPWNRSGRGGLYGGRPAGRFRVVRGLGEVPGLARGLSLPGERSVPGHGGDGKPPKKAGRV